MGFISRVFFLTALSVGTAEAQDFMPTNVVPNPVPVGTVPFLHFRAFGDGCNFGYRLTSIDLSGSVVTLRYEVFPDPPPPPFFCPSPPYDMGVRQRLVLLPPGDYVARAQGTSGGVVLPLAADVPFVVLQGPVAVPTISLWGGLLATLAFFLVALGSLRRSSK